MTTRIKPDSITGDEPWHGTVGGYTNYRCDCDRCMGAHREYQNNYMRSNPHQRHLAVLRSRVRYWRDQVMVREHLRDTDPEKYKAGNSVTHTKRRYKEVEAEYLEARTGVTFT